MQKSYEKIFLYLIVLISISLNANCQNNSGQATNKSPVKLNTEYKVVHVLVALCDNKYQGIVPVPAAIGNGQDPKNNLYWGCSNGIYTYFKKSKEWTLVKSQKLNSIKLERAIFKHVSKNYYLVADAYDGKYIKQTTLDFFNSTSGKLKDTLHINKKIIGINGNAQLIAYIGHDGLMDFQLNESFANVDGQKRDAIMLACISKKYFSNHLTATKANPLVWTTGLMCPEAYTLHDAVKGYINGEKNEQIRLRAAMAYSKYQKCSLKASKNLLVTGY
ncbi:hypothetical protein [Pedobacter punctiformis]|uniref:Uncharacterized protein n=1 Tax=Pedobacter punctiformis TaxID=3004097 RepID=A0ABT4L7X2_9SPHI|nr:hypothetical protein [Pedobacter sp. HCMS5-2]MCZ4243258.1 hypothetical protein [Pedobacter sp. HCMS5-2]